MNSLWQDVRCFMLKVPFASSPCSRELFPDGARTSLARVVVSRSLAFRPKGLF